MRLVRIFAELYSKQECELLEGHKSEFAEEKREFIQHINTSGVTSQSKYYIKPTKYDWAFLNKKSCEEETRICQITMLQKSYVKWFLLVPFLCLWTIGTIFLFCYWYVSLKRWLFYSKTTKLSWATHLLVRSTRKQTEIVPLIQRK